MSTIETDGLILSLFGIAYIFNFNIHFNAIVFSFILCFLSIYYFLLTNISCTESFVVRCVAMYI